MIRIDNLVLSVEDSIEQLKIKAAKKLRISPNDIKAMRIVKESVDARKKNMLKFVYTIELECENEGKLVKKASDKSVTLVEKKERIKRKYTPMKDIKRPIVVGTGPAGLFAGLTLAENGFNPLIIERGEDVDARTKTVEEFWNNKIFNKNSNVQFGEGGAGTFSDGKLTTRIKDLRCIDVLEAMVEAGAPEEILYQNKPHVGTDILKKVVKNIRNKIIELGGEVKFNTTLEDLEIENNELKAAIINGERIECDHLILAIGHSSRDTYEMLYKQKVDMEVKPFAIGVRVEHDQNMINKNQHGKFAGHSRLGAADYKLTYTSKELGKSVYSFCMCPGGVVVAAASEEGRVVTNGMSYFARDKENANSAIVVSVGKEDFGTNPMDAINFQRKYEELAFKVGGSNYFAPVQMIRDFIEDKKSTELGAIKPSYTPGYTLARMDECLPDKVVAALREGLTYFDKKIQGFASGDGIMIGVETRTSAPVRVNREKSLISTNIKGLYPCGEGAGYAGGIISAAVDGIKCAEPVMEGNSEE